jgi:hypothetical protein
MVKGRNASVAAVDVQLDKPHVPRGWRSHENVGARVPIGKVCALTATRIFGTGQRGELAVALKSWPICVHSTQYPKTWSASPAIYGH